MMGTLGTLERKEGNRVCADASRSRLKDRMVNRTASLSTPRAHRFQVSLMPQEFPFVSIPHQYYMISTEVFIRHSLSLLIIPFSNTELQGQLE